MQLAGEARGEAGPACDGLLITINRPQVRPGFQNRGCITTAAKRAIQMRLSSLRGEVFEHFLEQNGDMAAHDSATGSLIFGAFARASARRRS